MLEQLPHRRISCLLCSIGSLPYFIDREFDELLNARGLQARGAAAAERCCCCCCRALPLIAWGLQVCVGSAVLHWDAGGG